VTTLSSDTFTGTNGAAWSATWATGLTPSGGGSQIQSNQGRLTCGTTGGYAGGSRVARRDATAGSVANAVALFSFQWPTGDEVYPLFYVRSNQSNANLLDGQAGYYVSLNRPAGNWTLGYSNAYAGTDLLTPVTLAFASATKYWCRFGAVGSLVQARVWADGAGEPNTWDRSTTDTTLTAAGAAGFSVGVGNAGLGKWDVDDYQLDDAFPSASFNPPETYVSPSMAALNRAMSW